MITENPPIQEIIERRGTTAQAFGIPLTTAAEKGYAIGPHLQHVSDSRVDFAEGQRLGEFFDPDQPLQVVSLFEGIGNTSLALARALPMAKIVAVELDSEVYDCAKHNVKKAGLETRITALQEDAVALLEDETTSGDVVFLDPHWKSREGGYTKASPFSLDDTTPPQTELVHLALPKFTIVAFRVPSAVDLTELRAFGEIIDREVFVDNHHIEEPRGQNTNTVFLANTGKTQLSIRRLTLTPPSHDWRKTAYETQN